jgi:hypothetical protein
LTDRLGNEIAGYLQEQIPAPEGQQNDGFFGFLQFSPSQEQRSVTVEEFHQRNQEFLQQSEYARSKMQKAMRDNSPHRQYVIGICWYRTWLCKSHICLSFPFTLVFRHMTTSPRQRSHRPGLYSIDDDDWDDDHDEQSAQKVNYGSDKRGHNNSRQQQYHSSDPHRMRYEREDVSRAMRTRNTDRRSRTVEPASRTSEATSDSIMSSR